MECVVASRLARKLCVECRQPTTIDQQTLREAGYEDDIEAFEAYTAVGCARCSNTGYRGRTGLFEVLSLDEEIRNLLLERYPSSAIEQAAVAKGMTTLKQSALDRVRQGLISLEEAARVTRTD